MNKTEIVKIHIESDLVNKLPTLVYTDANGIEWVLKSDSIYLEEKSKSWYFNPHSTKY